MTIEELIGRTFEITPKHTGWTSKIAFNRWQKYGKDRLYYSFRHYGRKGTLRNHYDGKGYIDLETGEFHMPPSDRFTINKILESEN